MIMIVRIVERLTRPCFPLTSMHAGRFNVPGATPKAASRGLLKSIAI